MRSKPQTPKETQLVSVHTKMSKDVDMIFARHPLDLGGGGSNPPGPLGFVKPSRYFGLPMMNLGRPPLPLNRPYCQPLNYHEYVKDFNRNAHVRVF